MSRSNIPPSGMPRATRPLGVALLIAAVLLSFLAFSPAPAFAANPPPQQTYFNPLPEDDLLQLFDDNEADGGTNDPVSPVRSVTSISIWSTGTWIYWDQWEDGGYESDIANPGTNVYSSTNRDGTQIWGDGVLGNGCPPNIGNVPNPCVNQADDQFQAGDIIILDNQVAVAGTNPGPYSRTATQVFYDGRDKFATSFPVAVTRGAFPINPGSVMAGAVEVLDTSRWGTSYEAPVGENTPDTNTSAFEDVRWFIMAGVGGATVAIDRDGNGSVDQTNTLTQGAKLSVNGILEGATLTVTSGNPVQVDSMTADVDDIYEFRWDALVPRSSWTNEYYTPVGTDSKSSSNDGCTEVLVYNPNSTGITVNVDWYGGVAIDDTISVPAGTNAVSSAKSEMITLGRGARLWSAGGQNFLPLSITDCTQDTSDADGRMYDWGTPLFPASQLSSEVLVGWAPGCSNESLLGICDDADITFNDFSRNVVWVTAIANTTIYLDTNGSGIDCAANPVTGAEQSQAATALASYRFDDDPTSASTVRDDFTTRAYNNQNGTASWSTNWTETGDDGSASAGDIQIQDTGNRLEFNGGAAGGDAIQRSVNLTGRIFADLTFSLASSGNLDDTDDLAVDVSNNGGSTWRTVAVFENDPLTEVKAIVISQYISSNTTIRFRMVDTLESTDYWYIDSVQIKYATNGDYDMTGSRIKTCDGTAIAVAWGQNPAFSDPNDGEALDMGAGVAPFGARLRLDKSADKTEVAKGELVTYTYLVDNLSAAALSNVTVTDNRCSPATYISGDTNADGKLAPYPAESWTFRCTSNIYVDTDNVAFASGTTDTGTTVYSPPDEWLVTVTPSSSIGNYVWLDEDSDGQQDAGEPGIANVTVQLSGIDEDGNPLDRTTYTDEAGGYIFDGLPPSNASGYTVTVVPPAGTVQTYDEDDGTAPFVSPNATTVVLPAGVEHETADFGYNWTDINGPLGSIGDRVWLDANGDGLQDPGEAGLANIEVTLYYDPDGDGTYDTPYDVSGYDPTRLTGAAGDYIFDSLPHGTYSVKVTTPPANYTQTGDPDDNLDNKTTYPVVLAPGDVYLNADFGYQPIPDNSDIGDIVWFDADNDGCGPLGPGGVIQGDPTCTTADSNEVGIPGVTVALARDDGDGMWEPGVDQIIATDITDENGLYLFPRLIAGTYYVLVDDTENVLGEFVPTYDPDGGKDDRSKVTVNGAADNLQQDFGYAPSTPPGKGLIGDTVWLDMNGNLQPDDGEGIEGVQLTLRDPGFDGILGNDDDTYVVTYTNENGNYAFGSLEPSSSYRVTVDAVNFNAGGPLAGLSNVFDPDGTEDSTTVRDLSVTGPVDLAADFGYRDTSQPNSIGGTIWRDSDASGTLDGDETVRFSSITVVLRDTNGDVIASTNTDSNGNYLFQGLPDGTYLVDVTDDLNKLNGYWKSEAPTPGADNNSQVDPYEVAVLGGETDTTGDFGYYKAPAALGDFVWKDDGDGIQESGELGITGARVTLVINYPDGRTTTLTTVTNGSGLYLFDNLLLDENFNGTGGPEPVFTLSAQTPGGFVPTLIDQGGNDSLDSDNQAGVTAVVSQGEYNPTYDFGFIDVLPVISVLKSANPTSVPAATGGSVTFTYDVTNNSQVYVTITNLTDDKFGSLVGDADCQYGTQLAPNGGTCSFQATFTVPSGTPGGSHVDVFTATAVDGDGDTDSDDDDATVTYTYDPATLGDLVWVDTNGNGIQDSGETGLAGVTVTLYNGSGTQVGTPVTTPASGAYSFPNLTPGQYKVCFTNPPAGYVYSPTGQGTTSTDSDANAGTPAGCSALVTLTSGQTNTTVDAGLYQNATLGDLVWVDTNGNGIQDSGEVGLNGVTVDLHKVGVTGVFATTTTSGGGLYSFPNLVPGDYYVDFTLPAGYQFSPVDQGGNDALDSDANITSGETPVVTLTSGQSNMTLDAGLIPLAGISGQVREDLNADGNPADPDPAISGVTVTLWTDPNGDGDPSDGVLLKTTTTDAQGNYSFTNLSPGNYVVVETDPDGFLSSWDKVDPNDNRIPVTLPPGGGSSTGNDFLDYKLAALGDFVWVDANANGIQDNGEVGLDNVTVELHKVGTTGVFATATTSGGGLYSFPNLLPASYYVHFVLPAGYLHSPANQGSNDQVDSDANTTTGDTPVTALVSGQTNNSLDAGMIPAATLGDTAWVDANGNGIQDSGELGLPGVKVDVYRTSDNSLAGTDTTDGSGIWSVPGLAPGDYYVQFTPPAGYNITLPNQGANDQLDSDPDPVTGKTATITLTPGEVDNSVDAGFLAPNPNYTLTKTRVSEYSSRPGRRVEFKIHIENTGSLPITFLPLQDTYETAYLTYGYNAEFSTPQSVDNDDDGTLNWTDLTAAAPYGFGQPLEPGKWFDITVVFTAKEDTTSNTGGVTTNTAKVEGAQFDPDGPGGVSPVTFPKKEASDVVEILNPTSVAVSSFTARAGLNGVRLDWATSSEAEILGFNLWRKTASGSFELVNGDLILATNPGLEQGAIYNLPDTGLKPGAYTYRLETVSLDGVRQVAGEVAVKVSPRWR